MLLVWVLAAAVAVGYLRGGRLKRYLARPLRWPLLPVAAFLLEALIPLWQRLPVPESLWLGCMVALQYGLLFLFCLLNRGYGGSMALIALGSLSNLCAMVCNGFRMPVSPAVYDYPAFAPFIERVLSGELPEYVLVGYDAPLWFLGDALPLPVVIPGMASLGDALLGAGVFWLIQRAMGAGKCRRGVRGRRLL